MKFDDYRKLTTQFNQYPRETMRQSLILGFAEEVVEYVLAETPEDKIKELGDVCWYVAELKNEGYFHDTDNFPLIGELEIVKRTLSVIKKGTRGDFGIPEGNLRISRLIEAFLGKIYVPDVELACKRNIEKLLDRQSRNVIKGDGDNR